MTERRPWASLIVLCIGTFAILLDTTIVNVAVPSLVTDLHASLDQAVWVVNPYLLVFTALLSWPGGWGTSSARAGCSSSGWRCPRWPPRCAEWRGHRASSSPPACSRASARRR
jgi:MFS family permease